MRDVKVRPPHKAEPFVIARVSHNKKWDDQTLIQCNVCKNPNKFLNEGYVAAYPDGWLYILGPDCGKDEHRRSVRLAIRDHLYREAEQYADGALVQIIEQFDEWKAYYANVHNAAKVLFAYHKRFKQCAPNSFAQLCTVRKTGGSLEVMIREAGCSDAGYYSDAITETIGSLRGSNFFNGSPPGMKSMRSAQKILEVILGPDEIVESFWDQVCNAADDDQRQKLLDHINKGLRDLRVSHDEIESARQALEYENFRALEKWGADSRNHTGFSVKLSQQDNAICASFGLDDFRCVRVELSDLKALCFGKQDEFKRG
ncbi:MAG: hypothetical protein GXP06_04060 [Alphaproteobacteria bacterium]|nr:hypothetical protein [Alphaproteobacteria bacterium]